MQQFIRSRRFALVELILIVLAGCVSAMRSEWGIWFILIAILPVALRGFGGGFTFNLIDWLVLVFVITAWAGYWAAYAQVAALGKAWLIVTAALLYFSLKAQPKQNLVQVSAFLFSVGVGISLYYLLTHDFIALPRKLEFVNQLGRWIMTIRPQTGWTSIHPNYVAGMIAVTVPFILPIWSTRTRHTARPSLVSLAVIAGLMVAGLALFMATSRGVVLAVGGGVGGWLLWRSVQWTGIRHRIKSESVFPILLLVYLCVVVIFLYIGPAHSGSLFTGNYFYGDGSRFELFTRSSYLLLDYPITGGGLDSFPGLYSQYLLDIPYFNVSNSHNLFMEVGIEQGLLGGLSVLILYLSSLWIAASDISKDHDNRLFRWVVLFSLIIAFLHSMVDNYLYNGIGTMFSLFLVGLSMNGQKYHAQSRGNRGDLRTVGAIVVICAIIAALNWNQMRAVWYANLGAVQLAKVELAEFPGGGWMEEDIIPRLDEADASLRSALRFDPTNRTANHRLGLISMYGRDFAAAAGYLEIAHAQAPNHRGIVKSLAYCYIWLGELDKAQEYLALVPEAVEELDVYIEWWNERGRSDLSRNATLALDVLK